MIVMVNRVVEKFYQSPHEFLWVEFWNRRYFHWNIFFLFVIGHCVNVNVHLCVVIVGCFSTHRKSHCVYHQTNSSIEQCAGMQIGKPCPCMQSIQRNPIIEFSLSPFKIKILHQQTRIKNDSMIFYANEPPVFLILYQKLIDIIIFTKLLQVLLSQHLQALRSYGDCINVPQLATTGKRVSLRENLSFTQKMHSSHNQEIYRQHSRAKKRHTLF